MSKNDWAQSKNLTAFVAKFFKVCLLIMPGGNKRQYILEQTCSLYILSPPGMKRLIHKKYLRHLTR